MEDAKRPQLKAQPKEEECLSDASSTVCGSINSSGPQLCYSPPGYDSLSAPAHTSPNIQTKDAEQPEAASGEFKVYKRRWYVLLMFSLIAASQGGVWNVYGPIAATAEDAFGWTDATIALLSNWGPIAYLLAGIIFSWLLDVKGLRVSCVLTALLVAIGTAIKCITFETPAVTWMLPQLIDKPLALHHINRALFKMGILDGCLKARTQSLCSGEDLKLTHVGQLFNGLGGPVAMAAGPIVSATWFPTSERTTATAIGACFNSMGVAMSFIMGPLLVPDVPSNSTNSSFHSSFDDSKNIMGYVLNGSSVGHNETVSQRISKEKKAIGVYTYIGAGWCGALLLMFLLYFPSKPPRPPCASAGLQREDFLQGLKHVLTRKQFWLVALVYGTSLGILNSWSSVLDVILKPHGISQNDAGWIGFYATCSGCAVALLVARFADFFKRFMKRLVFISYTIGTAVFLVFALAAISVISTSKGLFYTTIIVGITSLNAAVPLMFELGCELAYPAGEGTTNIILTIVNNIFGLIFLFLMMIPGIGSMWTNWVVAGTTGICLPVLLLMKERFNRLEVDERNPSLNAQIVFPSPQQ